MKYNSCGGNLLIDNVKKIRIHGKNIEDEAIRQFTKCHNNNFVLEAALMPDAHSGYVAPIGSVIKTKGVIVPSWVGYDIGCGMIAIKISDSESEKKEIMSGSIDLFNAVNEFIPMGVGQYNSNHEINNIVQLNSILSCLIFNIDMEIYKKENMELFNIIKSRALRDIGTLGSGNHFIEILTYLNETWLVIHSGSRSVGHYLGTYFMKESSSLEKGYEDTYGIFGKLEKKRYMIYHDFCLQFALLNRIEIAERVKICLYSLFGIDYVTLENMWTNKNHNHCIEIQENIYIHRKGATSSELEERGVIPANMRDGCFLVEGLGNSDFMNSSSHGAGRKLSRGEAKRSITLDQFKESMDGILAPINDNTIDESPMAYKNIFEVMELQSSSVKVLKHLKPIINWKG